MAQRGADPVLGIVAQGPYIAKIAKEFPDTRFAIIDTAVDAPNVLSIEFKEHEGSFLVGMLGLCHRNRARLVCWGDGYPIDPPICLWL